MSYSSGRRVFQGRGNTKNRDSGAGTYFVLFRNNTEVRMSVTV